MRIWRFVLLVLLTTVFGLRCFTGVQAQQVTTVPPSILPTQTDTWGAASLIPAIPTTSHAVTASDYPPIALSLRQQGKVDIEYTIDTNGDVSDCVVTISSHIPRLDDAACTIVEDRWKFRPAIRDGKPVKTSVPAEVEFVLDTAEKQKWPRTASR